MKRELGSQLELGEYSHQRFESKGADFSDDMIFHMTNYPVASHATSNEMRRLEVMGEFVLVQAILREAIRTYQKFAVRKGTRANRLFREVSDWFSADDRQWFFSFVNVCDVLGLEPTYIRTGLKLWRERRLSAASSSAPVRDLQPPVKRSRYGVAATA
jgi:hypothetical protein